MKTIITFCGHLATLLLGGAQKYASLKERKVKCLSMHHIKSDSSVLALTIH